MYVLIHEWDECDRFTNTYTFSFGTNTFARFTIRLIAFASVRFSLSLSRNLHIRTRAHIENVQGMCERPPNEEMLGRISEDHVLRITYIPTTPFGSTCLHDSLSIYLSICSYLCLTFQRALSSPLFPPSRLIPRFGSIEW